MQELSRESRWRRKIRYVGVSRNIGLNYKSMLYGVQAVANMSLFLIELQFFLPPAAGKGYKQHLLLLYKWEYEQLREKVLPSHENAVS